jgi:hypothetical protein
MKKLVAWQHGQIAAIGMRDDPFRRETHSIVNMGLGDGKQYMKQPALFPYNTTLNWSLHGRRSCGMPNGG